MVVRVGKGIILMIFYYSILGFLNLPVTDDFHIFLCKIVDGIYTSLSLGNFERNMKKKKEINEEKGNVFIYQPTSYKQLG